MSEGSRFNLFVCSSPLQVLTAHVITQQYLTPIRAMNVLAIEGVADERILDRSLWSELVWLHDSRRELGRWSTRLRENLRTLRDVRRRYASAHATVLVSDLQWLMNNTLVADIFAQLGATEAWELALFDEGLVLYLQDRFGIRHAVRSVAKFLLLRTLSFPALLVTPWNADYRHPLCRRVYCWHPRLLADRVRTDLHALDPGRLSYAIKLLGSPSSLGPGACLYLSQPLYKLIGLKTHRRIVQRLKTRVLAEGYSRLYYKPHHHDMGTWITELECEYGFVPLHEFEQLPAEVVVRALRPGLIAGHTSSALSNIAAQGYDGRIMAFGVDIIARTSTHRFLRRIRQLFQEFPQIEMAD